MPAGQTAGASGNGEEDRESPPVSAEKRKRKCVAHDPAASDVRLIAYIM